MSICPYFIPLSFFEVTLSFITHSAIFGCSAQLSSNLLGIPGALPVSTFPRGSTNQGPTQKLHLNLPKSSPYPGLQLLELFLPSLQCQLLGLIQTKLQVLHCLFQVLLHPLQVIILSQSIIQMELGVSLHLLLQPQGFIPAPDLSIQGALHGLHNSEVVPLHLINLLIFLCYLPVNLSLHLVELKLQAQDLPLLMFQGGLEK
uniref:Uncharacterized protein n=1 Tax=Geospiza parvula TaxID=87175 RepID=A0A8C3NMX1_GEOPR